MATKPQTSTCPNENSLNDNLKSSVKNAHSVLVNDALFFIGAKPGFVVWKNHVGTARMLRDPGKLFKYGLVGSPDIIGFGPDGRFFGGEVKTGSAVQTREQKNFQRICNAFNAHYLIIRELADIEQFLVTNYPKFL